MALRGSAITQLLQCARIGGSLGSWMLQCTFCCRLSTDRRAKANVFTFGDMCREAKRIKCAQALRYNHKRESLAVKGAWILP